ncbi:hypothetical protein [Lysobacter xanthus]
MASRIIRFSFMVAAASGLAGCGDGARPDAVAAHVPAPAAHRDAAPVRPTTAAPSTTSLASDRLNRIVDEVLRSQYPEGFDARHGCWRAHYGSGDESTSYCMRTVPASAVVEGGQQVIYAATASAADIGDDDAYRYGAIDPGTFDAFRIVVLPDGSGRLIASGKGMEFGSAGDCGCHDADLVALGPDIHGWVFSSGATQQGITVGTHSIVAPVDANMIDVSDIPQYVEDDPDLEYRIAIGSDAPKNGWFPITVSKYRTAGKLASRTIDFDLAAKRYRMPESF